MPPKVAKVDSELLAAIRNVVKEELQPVTERLDKLDSDIGKLTGLLKRMDDVEKGLQHTSDRVDSLVTDLLPAINSHIAKLSEALAHQTLKIDVHRRKWNVIVHGLEGAVGEDEVTTRNAVFKFAKDALKVNNAKNTRLAACHRLSRKENSGVILRFCDLADRDKWITGTKNLKDFGKKMSVSPDLPPVLRPLKDELMKTRSELAPDVKSKSRVRYLPQWPFVELRIEGRNPIRPNTSLGAITKTVLGVDPLLVLAEK